MKSLTMPQQIWLQSLISMRLVTESHAKAMHKAAVQACSMTYRPSEYEDFYAKIAKAIQIVGLDIRRTRDETKGVKLVILVNTKGDEIAQLATTFSPHEITLVKQTIEKIITAPHESFCLGSMQALDLAAKLNPPIPATKAEMVCDKLIRHGWLRQSQTGKYSLTPRSLMELQSYLQTTFEGHILFCNACKDIVTALEELPGAKVCKSCKEVWKTFPVGEGALLSGEAELRKEREAARRQRLARANAEDESDIDADEDEGGTEQPEEDAVNEEEDNDDEDDEDDEERHRSVQQQQSRKRAAPDTTAARRPTRAGGVKNEADVEDDRPRARRSRLR